MTPTKPRPFLVVLATTVASQDGVVAAGDSVRNCRTRPGAEQRLLPATGHPIPGKCEPRFTLSPNYPPARVQPGTPAALGRERLWPAGSARSPLAAGRFPSSPRPPRPARRPASPFPPRLRSSRRAPPHAALSLPAPGFLPVEFPPREEKSGRPGPACCLTSAWEGGKERLIQVSQGGAGRGGGRGDDLLPGVELKPVVPT